MADHNIHLWNPPPAPKFHPPSSHQSPLRLRRGLPLHRFVQLRRAAEVLCGCDSEGGLHEDHSHEKDQDESLPSALRIQVLHDFSSNALATCCRVVSAT